MTVPARSSSPPTGKYAALDTIVRQGFVPIFVRDNLDSRLLVEAAVRGGCRAIEYTCRRSDAATMIPWIKREFPDVVVMAATLVDGTRMQRFLKQHRDAFITVDEAVDLGADALVSFMRFRSETYEKYGEQCVMIPGVATQSEALDQLELGADLIKTIVSSTAGSELVAIAPPVTHHSIPFFVSGGVKADNLENYVKAGVVVTTAGFDVLLAGTDSSDLVDSGRRAIETMITTMQAARAKHQPHFHAAVQAGTPNPLSAGTWFTSQP
ncbi:MAG: hypothetical protein H7A44_08265 [Opitutaceae bacterium]|nr:hypothetical protein [Cephaloticoccus sp.]MCP5530424.1 hypothetical protein [Opitutaceae bacterium]